MRLDQFIQLSCQVSRREAKAIVKSGSITVNGQGIQRTGWLLSLENDVVSLNDKLLIYDTALHYIILHKPKNYVCSHQDDGYLSIFRLINEDYAYNLHVAGRLDADTTGLVILTDDGGFSHRITHPKQQCIKKYRIETKSKITQEMLINLQKGVLLHDKKTITAPASTVLLGDYSMELHISEGRYHQVKRMLAAVDNHVLNLHRFQVGTIDLGSLQEGEYRLMTKEEKEDLNG